MNDAASQYKLYQIYKSGVSSSIDLPKANYFLQQSASLGYPQAMQDTCAGYYTGSIGLQNYERAVYWCNKSYQRGNNQAISYLANIYYKQGQYSKSLEYFLLVDNKSSQTEYIIGSIYLKLEKSPNNGYFWIRKAYDRKNNDAKKFVQSLSGKYGKCSIEDAYFKSSLSYKEALAVCSDINQGNITPKTAVIHTKQFFRTIF